MALPQRSEVYVPTIGQVFRTRGNDPSSPNFEAVLRFGLGLELPPGDKLESRRHRGVLGSQPL
jgi:hypothetical protein